MTEILLLIPPRESLYIVPPLGLGYITTELRKRNFSVEIIDCIKEKISIHKLKEILVINKPKIIGIQTLSCDKEVIKTIIKTTKKQYPNVKIILGGADPSSSEKEFLKEYNADFGISGESEINFSILAEVILRNKKIELETIPGLIWKEGNKEVFNKKEFIKNLDKPGFPSWDLMEPRSYEPAPQAGFFDKFPYAPISTSRGCPYACTFCSVFLLSGEKIRERDIKNVVEEIKLLTKKHGVKEIHIVDDAFTFNKKRVIKFCKELKKAKIHLSIKFPNGVRLDSFDKELASNLKDAGVRDIMVGIESGSQKVLDKIKKGITLEEIKNKINLINSAGISVGAYFILGFPGETKEDIKKTMKFARENNIKRAQFSLFKPYPNTPLTNELIKNKEINHINSDSLLFYEVSYSPKGIKPKELKKLQRKAFIKFYSRPKIIFNLIKDIKSVRSLRFILKRVTKTIV